MQCVKLKIVWIGKGKDVALENLTAEYLKRIARYTPVEGMSVKDEAALMKLARSASKHVLVLLDSRGKEFTSEELAQFLADHRDRNPLPLMFVIGPANGFSDEARRASNIVLSLSKMTLAHELARVVLLEQVYRAFTILHGHPYHSGH